MHCCLHFQNENVARPEDEMPAYDDEGTKAEADDIYPRQTVLVAPESRDFRRYLLALVSFLTCLTYITFQTQPVYALVVVFL